MPWIKLSLDMKMDRELSGFGGMDDKEVQTRMNAYYNMKGDPSVPNCSFLSVSIGVGCLV